MEINISDIMDALNRKALYGLDAGKHWYGFGTSDGHRASDCIQCGQCEAACPQHLPIIDLLKECRTLE
jgi:predicted aldo/keto reductase-like oxidoreductase